jgi:hypothetical protein
VRGQPCSRIYSPLIWNDVTDIVDREERAGVGRVWRLKRFWEQVGRGDT